MITNACSNTANQQTRINGLAVTRALGDHFAKENGSGMIAEPSLSPVYKLTPEDEYFMLASDGVGVLNRRMNPSTY